MIEVLNLIVKQLITENLTAKEQQSLKAEIVKNSALVDSLRNSPTFDSSFIDAQGSKSQRPSAF